MEGVTLKEQVKSKSAGLLVMQNETNDAVVYVRTIFTVRPNNYAELVKVETALPEPPGPVRLHEQTASHQQEEKENNIAPREGKVAGTE